MHMMDTLVSPVVGGVCTISALGMLTYSAKKSNSDLDEKKIPLMGVMGAFVFAAQMINFSIPGTGSSGHLGGGMLLAVLLGPHAAFLTMAAILLIQALFFADGGLLAYGCNVINLGFFTCFVAYPLIYKLITRKDTNQKRILWASIASAVVGLQLGAFSVVLQTLFSGKTDLTFGTFFLMMQPIHLAIGVVEGLVTAAVVSFVWKSRPEILEKAALGKAIGNISIKRVLTVFTVAVIIIGGVISWFASSNPDGLEWSLFKATGNKEIEATDKIHQKLSEVQSKMAIMPDYSFKEKDGQNKAHTQESKKQNDQLQNDQTKNDQTQDNQEAINKAGTSVSGIIGGVLTLVLVACTGLIIKLLKRKNKVVA